VYEHELEERKKEREEKKSKTQRFLPGSFLWQWKFIDEKDYVDDMKSFYTKGTYW